MTLHLQCVYLILLGALQTKTLNASPTMSEKPSLTKVPLQPNFQDVQFQGKWYAVGEADSTIRNGHTKYLKMYSVDYTLKANHSFSENTTTFRNNVCRHSVKTLVQNVEPGQFTLGSYKNTHGILSYIMRVASTSYNQFAIVYVEKNVRFQWYFKMILYGRTKTLNHKLMQQFIRIATSAGFSKDNIVFLHSTGNDTITIDWDMRFS